MPHQIQFNWRAYDTIRYPLPTGPKSLFEDEVPYCSDRVTDKSEAEILNWILRTPPARDLLFTNLDLLPTTYAQTSVIEPVLDRKTTRKPGDLDLILVAQPADPSRVISIQAKRVKVEAVNTYRDNVSNRHLGNVSVVIEQANGSRGLGFHLNYAMILIQVDGMARSEFNFLARGTTEGQFNRIYDRAWNVPLHSDVGLIFMEIAQPTGASIENSGYIAISVEKRSRPIEQPVSMNAKVRQLIQERSSM
jgi:hypothetical protein